LLDNAIKYSESGSAVELIAGREDAEVVIRVKDLGCGIDVSASPVSSTTLHSGYYEMLVDPGTF